MDTSFITDPQKAALLLFVAFVVTEGLKAVGRLILKNPDALTGWGAQVTNIIVSGLLLFLEGWLPTATPQAQQLVQVVFGLLMVVFGSGGMYQFYKRFAPQSVKVKEVKNEVVKTMPYTKVT